MTEFDVHDAAKQLDTLIERRAREAEVANQQARAQAESLRAYHLRGAVERRAAWEEHHRRMIATHEALAARRRVALDKLVDGKV